jgi:hypothetical protein
MRGVQPNRLHSIHFLQFTTGITDPDLEWFSYAKLGGTQSLDGFDWTSSECTISSIEE